MKRNDESLSNSLNNKEQEYEISSTGYGLESVVDNSDQTNSVKGTDSSCGGL